MENPPLFRRGWFRRIWVYRYGYGMKSYRLNQEKLKARINHRLATEDYTCRLPKPPKPRFRYRLQLKGHPFLWSKLKVYK